MRLGCRWAWSVSGVWAGYMPGPPTRVTSVRLVAVADPAPVAEAMAAEFDVPRWSAEPAAVLDDP